MPNKYIDADALIDGIKQAKQTEFELAINARKHKNMVAVGIHESHVGFCNQILESIKEDESIEIIRCRDCRYFHNGYDEKCCINHRGVVLTDENGFCHHGKEWIEDG